MHKVPHIRGAELPHILPEQVRLFRTFGMFGGGKSSPNPQLIRESLQLQSVQWLAP